MKTPNYDNTVGKHPIPHAEGVLKDAKSVEEKRNENSKTNKKEKK